MNSDKKFFIGVIVALNLIFATAVHAEEVENYFAWEIENLGDYKPHNLLFKAMKYDNGIIGLRDEIYKSISCGNYSSAAMWCELTATTQQIAFDEKFSDTNLTELTAKLYFETGDFDKAEQKISFLADNAKDNLNKVRALSLCSKLLNNKGNYHEALQVTQEVDEILKNTPDEKLSLINQSQAAQAYCKLKNFDKSLEIAEKIYPAMQSTFGKDSFETLKLMSTLSANYLGIHRQEYSQDILEKKLRLVLERYRQSNPYIATNALLEYAEFCFVVNDKTSGEKMLELALKLALETVSDNDRQVSFQLYKRLNQVAKKNLSADNSVLLESEFGLICLNYFIGNIPQSIETCKKNLPKFKKVYGEKDKRTLYAAKFLSDNYIALGRYEDAKKIVEDRLNFCKKNFGERDERTVEFAINAANIYYRTGKYKTADKMIAELETKSRDILQNSSNRYSQFIMAKIIGSRLKGAYDDYPNFVKDELFQQSLLKSGGGMNFIRESLNNGTYLIAGSFLQTDILAMLLNGYKLDSLKYSPQTLEVMNKLAENFVAEGNLRDAEKFAKRVLNLSRLHFGENNLYEWMAFNALSKIRRAEGNFVDALKLDKQALKAAKKVCGKNSLECFQSLDSIASDYTSAGIFIDAIKLREKTLAEYKNILEESDALTNQMMTNLAENYLATGRYDDAVELCDKAFSLQKVPWYYGDNKISFYPCVTDLLKIKAQARKLSGDNAIADVNYRNLIAAYEFKRMYLNSLDEYDDESKSKWFSEIIADYKDAAAVSVNVNDKSNFAFYCAELCKGRNLIDRYSDVLIAKNYLLTPEEKNTLAAHEKFMTAARNLSEYAEVTNNEELFFNSEYVRLYLHLNAEEFTKRLREKFYSYRIPKDSEKQNLNQEKNFLENFDVEKNQSTIPNGACLIEFLKTADDSLLVTFLRNKGEVQSANISVSRKFFDKCELYHNLLSYATIAEMNSDEKYIWLVDDEYIIAEGRENGPTPNAEPLTAKSDADSTKWHEIRKKIAAELSGELMPTLEKFAGNSTYWIISSDAELNLIPFETLTYREKMLVETVDVSYVPSLAVMKLMKARERKNAYLGRNKELFAVGDAIYENADTTTSKQSRQNFFDKLRGNRGNFTEKVDLKTLQWENLEGTAIELNKVSPLFKDKEILRREQVTEKNLWNLNTKGELSKYKYLLFSTHGLFVSDMPEYSSIVLSQNFTDDEYDGYITVGEWMNYDLRSDLIYLSACESGRGGYRAGEGIVGIPYALTVAGNKDTVMSLWKIKDNNATAEFIATVFEKLRDGKSEVTALNETKREFLKQSDAIYGDQSVWAAFLLYGI